MDSEDDNEEELGDEAMMALDQNLSSLFAEQKLRIQARRDEKNKLQKEKMLRRDFQIRVSAETALPPPSPPVQSPLSSPPCTHSHTWLSIPILAAGPGPDRGAGDQAA